MSFRRLTLNCSQSLAATRARVQASTMAFICGHKIHFFCRFKFMNSFIDIVRYKQIHLTLEEFINYCIVD